MSARAQSRTGSGLSAIALVIALALGLALLASRRDWGPGGEILPGLGAAVAFSAFLPGLLWKAARDQGRVVDPIPYLPTLGVLYALYFGLPVLFGDRFTIPTLQGTNGSTERALSLALLGWFALLLGWRMSGRWLRRVRPLRLEVDPERAKAFLPWMIGIGFAAIIAQRVLPLPGGLMQPVRFLQMLFQVGLGLMALSAFRGELSIHGRRLLILVLIPIYLFVQVGVGSVAQLAYASLFLLFLAWGAGRRVPLVTLALLAGVLFFMRGNVHAFRAATWHGGEQADAGVWERSVLFLEILSDRLFGDEEGSLDQATEEVSARVAHLGTFAHVVALTPRKKPYWGGQTYAALPSTFIPRALWPDKPSKQVGQDFGHRYELLAPHDRTTAVNLPQLVELYANFGFRGVAMGMFVIGALYRLIQRLWNTPGSGDGTLILASVLLSRLILIESDFTLVWGAVLQYAVLLILVLRQLAPRHPQDRRRRWTMSPAPEAVS